MAGKEVSTETAGDQGRWVTVEYVGEPPYGREFIRSHTIERSSGKLGAPTEKKSFAGRGIEVPEDLVWSRDNGYKLRVNADLTDLVEALRGESYLKVTDEG